MTSASIPRAMRGQPAFAFSVALIAMVASIGVFGGLLAPQDPFLIQSQLVNQGSSASHWLGTDEFGRDLLSRLLIGVQPTLIVAIGATAIAAVFGTMFGIAGAHGRPVTQFIIMRCVDIMLSFPPILLALLAVGFWQSGVLSLIVVIGVVYIPQFARVAHSATLQVSRMEFMEAERAMGASTARVIFNAILPNILAPLVVQATLTVAAAILLESGLSFLGLGIVPPQPSWGQMIGTARGYLAQNPMYVIWPSLLLGVTILAINVAGDRLRDILDPRLRQE